MDSFNELWQVVSDYLRQTNSESIYNVWFSELEPISFDGSRAVLMTTAEFKRRILAQKFSGTLHSAFLNALGLDVDVEFIAPGEGYSQSDSSGSAAGSSEIDGSTRASNYFENTFDTFVVGASNKFAHAAAQAVAANPGKAYNPLFIYGNSGLGKTHLLNAICHEIKRNDPSMKIVLTDGEEFTNEFIEALNHRTTTEFQNKYRKVDVLLMDDVQFIAGRESTQEEMFHTFNTLYESGRQIVLTSDRPPREMTQLEDRLRTRFEWGLLADVTPPDFETRLAIVKNKAAALGMELPDKIASYIAENVTANVRQLEGTVNKILAYKDLLGSEADEATVTRAMQDILKKSNEYIPTPDNILDYISKYYGIEKEIICGQQRVKDAVAARQIAMYLIRGMTNLPVVEIGKVFDNRDHSTVLYSLKQVEKQMKKDPAFAETVKEIKTNINNRH